MYHQSELLKYKHYINKVCVYKILHIINKHVYFYRHPRHKKYIKQICEEMKELRNEKSKPVEILYSLIDSAYMTLL